MKAAACFPILLFILCGCSRKQTTNAGELLSPALVLDTINRYGDYDNLFRMAHAIEIGTSILGNQMDGKFPKMLTDVNSPLHRVSWISAVKFGSSTSKVVLVEYGGGFAEYGILIDPKAGKTVDTLYPNYLSVTNGIWIYNSFK